MPEHFTCLVDGCGGLITPTTDGNGRAVEICDACEERKRAVQKQLEEWARRLPGLQLPNGGVSR